MFILDSLLIGSLRFVLDKVVQAAEAEMPRGAKAVTEKLLAGGRPTRENAFKLPLVERTLAAVMAEARG